MKYLTFVLLFLSFGSIAQKWDKTYGTSYYREAFSDLNETYDKGYLISGWDEFNEGNWLIKTDVNGNLLWDKIIIHNIYEVGDGAIDQNNSGEIVTVRCLNFPNGDQ